MPLHTPTRNNSTIAAAPTTDDKVLGAMDLRLPTGPRLGRTILELEGLTRSIGGRTLFRAETFA